VCVCVVVPHNGTHMRVLIVLSRLLVYHSICIRIPDLNTNADLDL
jgi:hypothetical protein